MFVIGTAGHVDHGKSTLVQALTGIDPDRLREEKERGMTIDLGFAWLHLPGIESEVSVVDVPGHERFIKNMLAGVGGIDLALLVVAADEGVMPQTREHLAILDLLDVRAGVVAVTKSDLVDLDWLELVQADIIETLDGTSLAGSPLLPVSAVSGAGLEQLKEALAQKLLLATPKRDIGRPRLPIDRAFSVAGFGTVVTGTLIDGALSVGQEIVVEPAGLRSRVRGLQAHRRKVDRIPPGSRTAVNVAGLSRDELHRGMVLSTTGWLRATEAVDVRLTAVRDLARPLRHNAQVTFHTGAAETPARLRLLDADALEPGKEGWAQIKLFAPVAAVKGDRFVLRSPNATLAGGAIVDTAPRRHRRKHPPTLAALAALAEGSPEERLLAALAQSEPADVVALARRGGAGQPEVREQLLALLAEARVVVLGGAEPLPGVQIYTRAGFERLSETARTAVSAFLREHPLRAGMPREELKSRLGLQAKLFNALLARWVADGVFVERTAAVAPPGYTASLAPVQQREADAFLAALRAQPFTPPSDGMPDKELLSYLVDNSAVVAVTDGIVFDAVAFQQMRDGIVAALADGSTITLAQVRDLFGTTRRYAQALLEYLDEQHVTRRNGDERVLRDPAAGSSAPRAGDREGP
jgi:selenocysteine-specific elongation factor